MPRAKLESIPGAPPALLIILRELLPGRDWQIVRRKVRARLREAKELSLAFESENVERTEPADVGRFEIHAHGALDLLSGQGCTELHCRIASAEKLARSLCLLADRVWLTDHLSTEVMFLGRPTNAAIDRLMRHAMVLAPLLPLIEAGVIRFRSPWMPSCAACSAEFEHQVDLASKAVLRTVRRQVKVAPSEIGGFIVKTGNLFEPPLIFRHRGSGSSRAPTASECALEIVTREVRQILWTAREAAFTRGTVFSNSRAALAGMLHADGRLPRGRSELRMLEDSRAFDLPWVSELNPSQIVQLREEAAAAMGPSSFCVGPG